MRAVQLPSAGGPLQLVTRDIPRPADGQLLVRVAACGVCRTDLHIVDGDLPALDHPIVPGHEIVGYVEARGDDVEAGRFSIGRRVGVPWLGWTCGRCRFCRTDRENLCDDARFTGYHLDGGYADYVLADGRYCFPIPEGYSDAEAAPLLCAGLIGYRTLRMADDAERIGIYGFGAAAHIVAQIARYQGRHIYAFVRPGDARAEAFAREMGAVWSGGSNEAPPEPLDAALLFAPVGDLVPAALRAVVKGGIVVCGGIHMSAIPSFTYELLWGERRVVSVANLTRRDGEELLALAPKVPIKTSVTTFALEHANDALSALRTGRLSGAAVLLPA
ncbi:MAG: zinc-dependent alcohol dehydrogenase family protein [Sulfurifustaceae bacterium]